MTLNRVKLGRAVTFMKYFASVVSLIFLPKNLIWNKPTFPALNLLKFADLVENELTESISKKITIFLFLSSLSHFIVKTLKAFNKRIR